MSESGKLQMKVFVKLGKLLTPETVEKLKNAIRLPAGMSEEIGTNSIQFLNALSNWKQFNSNEFDRALQMLDNRTILPIARELEWLSSPQDKPPTSSEEQYSTKTFKELLSTELTRGEWVILATGTSKLSVSGKEDASEMLQLCLENGIITKDMKDLSESLEILERNELAHKVRRYLPNFKKITDEKFRREIYGQMERIKVNQVEWQMCLRKHMKSENKDVSVVLDEATVPLASVYTALTVIKIKPAKEIAVEESGINEIDFLRNIHKQVEHETVEVVDFDAIVSACESTRPTIWCMVGNPGSGKSFLCKHFAYMYGTEELTNFLYAVSIPCRSREWHRLEEARQEAELTVDAEFIVDWLSLSVTPGAKWGETLCEHLFKSDGEGLLIIIDGADEYTRNVPFQTTLLHKLLGRRVLARSTILLTSRPSAWFDFKYQHGSEFQIDSNFHVLGFSPANRDIYFEKRIETTSKLSAVHELFLRHDEIQQLSLVPVNASLFTALFNASDSILTQTLSRLYTELITYMVRRQLSRMGLKEESKLLSISQFHPAIRECIQTIGGEANQGIFERKLTSDKTISLKIDGKAYDSDRFGLMHVHLKVDNLGKRVKVWTFQHLTIQEYLASVSIRDNSWTNRCFIVRYLTSSSQYIAIYKMVIRFLCGILGVDAGRMTPILCRHTFPKPMSLHDTPMYSQLYYEISIVDVSDWKEFTQSYLQLCTVIIEMNSNSIPEHFTYFEKEFPYPLYLYFRSTISPNEWHCFIKSLKYVHNYQIINIRSDFVTSTQFRSFLTQLYSCSIHYLALVFANKDFDEIKSYTSLLSSATLPTNTRISISLQNCNLTSSLPSQQLFSSANQFAGSLKINGSVIRYQTLESLTNQFSSLENLFYGPKSKESDWMNQVHIIQDLVATHPLNGLCIEDPKDYLSVTPEILLFVPSLKELEWYPREYPYKVLPYLQQFSSLTFLQLTSAKRAPLDDSLRQPLSQLIENNSNSLKEIYFVNLHCAGFHNWSSYFSSVILCSNLVTLMLTSTNFSSEEISCWYSAVESLKSLVYLLLAAIPLQDSGLLVLCHSLAYHSTLRRLRVEDCELSSDSCYPLMCLIQTLPHLKILEISRSELSSPIPELFQLLTHPAEECSVEIQFRD